jgi:hypothetical protein
MPQYLRLRRRRGRGRARLSWLDLARRDLRRQGRARRCRWLLGLPRIAAAWR